MTDLAADGIHELATVSINNPEWFLQQVWYSWLSFWQVFAQMPVRKRRGLSTIIC